MPYIKPADRNKFAALILAFQEIAGAQELNAGDMNYLITRLVDSWLGDTVSYEVLNNAHGMLASTTSEFYRRVVAPYEDRKIKQNGDAYTRRNRRKKKRG